ncbi:MAG TPA: hypothetical protein VEZ24_15910 [Microvirga sp.]|nr:hypothetical protein [Microvirga sp.]
MRQRAENAGWRSRDIAVAIVMGMSLEHQKQADAGNNPEDKEAAKEFFMSLMDAVFAHKDWYNTDNLQQAGVWANELVPPKELA